MTEDLKLGVQVTSGALGVAPVAFVTLVEVIDSDGEKRYAVVESDGLTDARRGRLLAQLVEQPVSGVGLTDRTGTGNAVGDGVQLDGGPAGEIAVNDRNLNSISEGVGPDLRGESPLVAEHDAGIKDDFTDPLDTEATAHG